MWQCCSAHQGTQFAHLVCRFWEKSGVNGEIVLKLDNVLKFCQLQSIAPKLRFFDKMAVSQRWEIEIQLKLYPTFYCICPISAKMFWQFSIIRSPLNRPHKLITHLRATLLCFGQLIFSVINQKIWNFYGK